MVRPASTSDDATPNPNAIAAQNLIRLAALTGDHQWREKADRLFDGVLGGAGENVLSHAALLNAIDLRLNAAEIVLTGPDHARFAQAALRLPYLNRVVLRAPEASALPHNHPAQAKIASDPRAQRSSASAKRARCRWPIRTRSQTSWLRCGPRVALEKRSAIFADIAFGAPRPARRGTRLRPWRLGALLLRAWFGSRRPALGARGGGCRRWLCRLLRLDARAAAPQHRDPGRDVLAGVVLGVAVGERRQAQLHELVIPRGDAEEPVLGLRAVAGQWKVAHWNRVRLPPSSMVKFRRR